MTNNYTTLAFDIYGTLIDTHSITTQLRECLNCTAQQAQQLANLWRQKQLEYTFRLGLMGKYLTFKEVTEHALKFTLQTFNYPLQQEHLQTLMLGYSELQTFPDVQLALKALQDLPQVDLVAFSNGDSEWLQQCLQANQLDTFFSSIISVENCQTFKPNPMVYQHLLNTTHLQQQPQNCYLISSNPFDIIGANACNLSTVWLQRTPTNQFDSWGEPANHQISTLTNLVNVLPSA